MANVTGLPLTSQAPAAPAATDGATATAGTATTATTAPTVATNGATNGTTNGATTAATNGATNGATNTATNAVTTVATTATTATNGVSNGVTNGATPKRRRQDPTHNRILEELMRCAREDPDDLWAVAIRRAEASAAMSSDEVASARAVRRATQSERTATLAARAAANNRWMLDNEILRDKQVAVAGTFVGALHNTATADGAAAAATAPGVAMPPGYEIPSAGPAFDPPIRAMGTFLDEVRSDMLTPMRHPSPQTIRGLPNPGALCYRNAVLTALLHTERFLSFLQAHARRTMTLVAGVDEVAHHLLTRLYHLAQAYGSATGVHPMSMTMSEDSYAKLTTMFWRACKYGVDGQALGELDVAQCQVQKQLPDGGGYTWQNKSWARVCAEGDSGDGGDGSGGDADLCNQQQDAAEFLDWLVEMAATQLYVSPERYAAARSSDYYDCMFRTYITSRYVCGQCLRPVRLRSAQVDREASIKLNVAARFPSERRHPDKDEPRRVFTLQDYLGQYFNEDLTDRRCARCAAEATPAKPMRRVRRMQTTPEILNVHLMRTELDMTTFAQHKNHDVVDVPEFLDVTKWLEPHTYAPGSQVFYRLTAVISHKGETARSGHYVSHVRTDAYPHHIAKHTYQDVRDIMRATRDTKTRVRAQYRAVADDARRAQLLHGGRAADPHTLGAAYRAVEAAHDSAWARISDETVTHGVPYARIINTTPDETHTPAAADWFDPVVLVYEKWVEKFVTDRRSGRRVYRAPMNLPGMTLQPKQALRRTAVAEQQMRATMDHDVQVPEQWPPTYTTAPLPEIYRAGYGDYGIDADQLGLVVDEEEEEDSDGDGDGQPRKKRRLAREEAMQHMEEFFGWGAYDAELGRRAAEEEAKRVEKAKKTKDTAAKDNAKDKQPDVGKAVQDMLRVVEAAMLQAGNDGTLANSVAAAVAAAMTAQATAQAAAPTTAPATAPATAPIIPLATAPIIPPARNGITADGSGGNDGIRGGQTPRLRQQKWGNNLFSPYAATGQPTVRPSHQPRPASNSAVQGTDGQQQQQQQQQTGTRQTTWGFGKFLGLRWR